MGQCTLAILAFVLIQPALDTSWECDGKPVGIVDDKRHEIVAPRYSRIDHLGNGILMAWSINPENRFEYGNRLQVFNCRGKELAIAVPEGAERISGLWLSSEAEHHPELLLEKLPEQALFKFVKDRLYGVCDAQGHIVLPPSYQFIGKASDGKVILTKEVPGDGEAFYCFDCERRKLNELRVKAQNDRPSLFFSEGLAAVEQSGAFGYMDAIGRLVIEPQFAKASPFRNGIATVSLQHPGEGKPQQVAIDKSGKTVSPSDMDVQEFHGGFAIARSAVRVGNRTGFASNYGVVNTKFEYVVPPRYSSLSWLSKPLPNILYPPQVQVLDESPLYCAYEGNREWLISPDGKIRVPISAGYPYFVSDELLGGRVIAKSPPGSNQEQYGLFDLTGKLVAGPSSYPPRLPLNSDGRRESFRKLASGLWLQIIEGDEEKFEPGYWAARNRHPFTRLQMFDRLLHQFDLIGMPQETLLNLLGDPDSSEPTGYAGDFASVAYRVDLDHYGENALHVKFNLRNSKVENWYFINGISRSAPNTSNVVLLTAEPAIVSGRLSFPETKPK